jgi:hypothetical protein
MTECGGSSLRYGTGALRKSAKLLDGHLPRRGRRAKVAVIQGATAAGELQTRRPAELSHAHCDDVGRRALAFEEIEKSVQLAARVGSRRHLDERGT